MPVGKELRDDIHRRAVEHKTAMEAGSWWHSIDLGHGQVTPGAHSLEELSGIYARFNLPDDLSGKRFLDVGCWDGFYSFEAERHGAEVVAVDCWRPKNFFIAQRVLQSKVEFREMSVYELSREGLGSFDIVLFHGVLYHLRHPLLGLECVCEVTDEFTIIESHVVDNLIDLPRPVMEFYERDELGGQTDNWWGPNSECLVRMARAAGFARTEVVHREPTRVTIKAYRRWADTALHRSPSLTIRSVFNAVTFDQQVPNRGRPPETLLSGRLESWHALVAFLAAHPGNLLTGIGFKTLPYSDSVGEALIADNMYLSMLVETGVSGLLLMLLFHAAVLRAAYRAARSVDAWTSFLGTWIFCFWVGEMFQMLSVDALTYWRVLPIYFAVLGLAVRETNRGNSRAAPSP